MTVKFTYAHTSSTAATLNVGGTGAKTIYNGMTGSTVTSGNGSWAAGEIVEFVYDGTYWRAVSSSGEWLHLSASNSYIPLDDNRYITAYEIAEAIDEVAPLAVYSETATQIGTWTDGRAVYRKCGTYTRSAGATLASIPHATGISYLNTSFVIRENYAVGKSDDECDGCYASQSEALAAMNSNTSEQNVMRYVVEYVALE
ncbi:MAG: hypothetical protein LIO59_05050 [Oscillospiraceae bacterium]|nr:hypothetical protein [Oscillospiraceae bacterium]